MCDSDLKDLPKVTISPHLLLPVTGAFQPKTWRSWWACPGCGVVCMTNDPPKPGKQRRTTCLDCDKDVLLVMPPGEERASEPTWWVIQLHNGVAGISFRPVSGDHRLMQAGEEIDIYSIDNQIGPLSIAAMQKLRKQLDFVLSQVEGGTSDKPKKSLSLKAIQGMEEFVDRLGKQSSPLKAIKSKCKLCPEIPGRTVEGCPWKDCALWLFRFGKRPEKMVAQDKGELVTRKRKT